MAARVDRVPRLPDPAQVLNGYPVRGATWQSMAALVNWLQGRGGTLVAACAPMIEINAASSEVFNFNLWPRVTSTQRVWCVTGYGVDSYAHVTAVVGGNTIGFGDWASTRTTLELPIVGIEDIASPPSDDEQTSIQIDVATGGAVITGIGVIEVPRFSLASGETRADIESMRPGSPIYSSGGANGTSGIVNSLTIGATARRNGLFHWSVPESSSRSTSLTTFPELFLLDPPVLARKFRSGDTTNVVAWRVYARALVQNGEVRATMSRSGDVDTITVTSGAGWGWWPAAGSSSLTIDCENLSASNGLQSSNFDEIDIDFRTVAGGGTIEIAGVAVGEPTS